ncbi:TetR/AcrR family transcriptional regulator [uncultured Litoreibacter sp.]|uniref:TetR/AcrR family transcriptional regulator n=1 Tax=uncultured Litoreibacter sp. TaxID=1392394 RepID=UPI0026119674|nr:TetR/AcrR family transcriptional regulator [uncultured Litoreibacter sp.]
MARQKSGDKENVIRRAVVAEVAAVGSTAVSVNNVAKRSGLAVGTLYRYFENKDALLRATYLAVKSEIHQMMILAARDQNTSKTKIRAMWFGLLEYAHQQPHDFIFAEVILNAVLLTDEERALVQSMSDEASAIVAGAVVDGTIRAGSAGAINTLLIAPALQIGRQSALSGRPLDLDHAEEVFALCWRAVST